MKEIVEKLILKNNTISCMESCTGGLLASEITNIEGASKIFNLGLITYSNDKKIDFGVNKEIIEKYTVYSNEVSLEMAKQITKISNSTYGVGITGKLGVDDLNNPKSDNNIVYISIFNSETLEQYNYVIKPKGEKREEKKNDIINFIKDKLKSII